MGGMIRDDMLERLRQLDEEAALRFANMERMRMVIVGGGALILLERLDRSTHDIDALDVDAPLIELLESYDINTRVKAHLNNFPYNYEDRLNLIYSGRVVDFYTASLEDIVIAKLYSQRDNDWEDICSPEVVDHIDWDVLQRLATSDNEARASALNEMNYRWFLSQYDRYERSFRK